MNKNKERELHTKFLMKKVYEAQGMTNPKHFKTALKEYTTWIDDNGNQHVKTVKVKQPKTEYIDLTKL